MFPSQESRLIDVPQAAIILGLTTRRVYQLIREGKIEARWDDFARKWVIDPQSLEEFRKRRAQEE